MTVFTTVVTVFAALALASGSIPDRLRQRGFSLSKTFAGSKQQPLYFNVSTERQKFIDLARNLTIADYTVGDLGKNRKLCMLARKASYESKVDDELMAKLVFLEAAFNVYDDNYSDDSEPHNLAVTSITSAIKDLTTLIDNGHLQNMPDDMRNGYGPMWKLFHGSTPNRNSELRPIYDRIVNGVSTYAFLCRMERTLRSPSREQLVNRMRCVVRAYVEWVQPRIDEELKEKYAYNSILTDALAIQTAAQKYPAPSPAFYTVTDKSPEGPTLPPASVAEPAAPQPAVGSPPVSRSPPVGDPPKKLGMFKRRATNRQD